MSEKINITFYCPNNDPDSAVEATLGVHIISMDLFFSKVKLVKRKDGNFYIAPPAEKYQCNKTGKTKYADYWWFGKNTSGYFQGECRKAIKKYCKEKGHPCPLGD